MNKELIAETPLEYQMSQVFGLEMTETQILNEWKRKLKGEKKEVNEEKPSKNNNEN